MKNQFEYRFRGILFSSTAEDKMPMKACYPLFAIILGAGIWIHDIRPAGAAPSLTIHGADQVPDGLSAPDWQGIRTAHGIRAAHDAQRCAFVRKGKDWVAYNLGIHPAPRHHQPDQNIPMENSWESPLQPT
jgi:hypothetical protein